MTKQTIFSVMAIIAIIGITGFLAACGGGTSPEFKTEFELTMLGKKITVIDDRANPSKQLDQMGIITKMQNTCNVITADMQKDETAQQAKDMIDSALLKNPEIKVEVPVASYNKFQTNGDNKSMFVDIDYLINITAEQTTSNTAEGLPSALFSGLNSMNNGTNNHIVGKVGEVDGIPVYRIDGVSVADGETAMANLNTAYGVLAEDSAFLSAFTSKVTKIHIVSGTEVTLNGTILEVGVNAEIATILACFYDEIMGFGG